LLSRPNKLAESIEGCHELIKQLIEVTEGLIVQVEQLRQENRALKERLDNNSSNSSLPPSQDYKKKNAKKPNTNPNKGGGRRGHKGHFRELLSIEQVDELVPCRLPKRCACGGRITVKEECVRHQVYELPKIQLQVTEYQLETGVWRCCRENKVA
jgi:transposase